MKKSITLLLLLQVFLGNAQNDSLITRLKAINNKSLTFYNVDGTDITHQTFSGNFSEKNLKKIYRKYSIKKSDEKIKDEELSLQNLKVIKVDKVSEDLMQVNVYYFVAKSNEEISVFWFGYFNSNNEDLEHKIIQLVINDQIPKTCFTSPEKDEIDFIGRELALDDNCYWANINNVQCPYNGQISWSIHETEEGADNSKTNQLKYTKSRKNGKVIKEEEVSVLFENVPTKALKIVYDFNGVSSLIAGGENLTVFYISEKIRNRHVSCTLSFWNNDNKTSNGIAPLLEKVMTVPTE